MGTTIPRFTLDGVQDAQATVHPFWTEDGLGLTLTRFHRADCDDVVLLIHGLTSSSDMYIMPEHRNLATFLLDNGFTDVWALDFRMSNRFPYDTETHRFTVDDVAHYDHPAALNELRRHVGNRRIHVIAHCVGSISFSMSLAAGTVDGITSLICNSVSLVQRLPTWSRLKITYGPAIMEYILGYAFVDPRYGHAPRFTRGWLLSRLISLFHRDCDNHACHIVSFMWGTGDPAIFQHENLDPITHERTADLESAVGLHYYRHIRKMAKAEHAVKYDPKDPRHAELPDDYLAAADRISTPILFLTGDHNHVFTDSNVVCHELLSKAAPGLHELEILPGYGHQDTFCGKNSDVDVFPRVLDHLQKHSGDVR